MYSGIRFRHSVAYICCVVILALSPSRAMGQSSARHDAVLSDPELEPGYGLGYTHFADDVIEPPRLVITDLAISPQGTTLAFLQEQRVRILDIASGVISELGQGHNIVWCGDGNWLAYYAAPDPQFWIDLVFWNRVTGETIQPRKVDSSRMHQFFPSPDGNLYYMDERPARQGGQVLLRVLVDQTLQSGSLVVERIGIHTPKPVFHPVDSTFYLSEFAAPEEELNRRDGFSMIRGFKADGRKDVFFPLPDSTWESSVRGRGGVYSVTPWYLVCPDGSVLLYRAFRHKNESIIPPYDSATLAARNASGWYHCDSLGNGLRHIVRSWTFGLGISVDRAGRVYYGFLMPDSTVAIWSMNSNGSDKRQVTFGPSSAVRNDGKDVTGYSITLTRESGGRQGSSSWICAKPSLLQLRYLIFSLTGQAIPTEVRVIALDDSTERILVDGAWIASGSCFLVGIDQYGVVRVAGRL
jgi:hypothetical protein